MELHAGGLSESILEAQNSYERRFNCIVCLEAKLAMVYGYCQHRLCADCLYSHDGTLRPKMNKCPVCAMTAAFPAFRPDIPDDNIEIQRCLGVRNCPNKDKGCQCHMWEWEIDEHRSTCMFEMSDDATAPVSKKSRCSKTKAANSSRPTKKRQIKRKAKVKASASIKKCAEVTDRRSTRLLRPRNT